MSIRYVLADKPTAVVEARGCTQVAAFMPFTALPAGKVGKRFAIVEVLGEVPAEQEAEPDVPWLV